MLKFSNIESRIAHRQTLLLLAGALASLVIALCWPTDNLHVSAEAVRMELAKKDDVYNIYHAAAQANWSDVPRWWIGPWIYPGVQYYRPVTSLLFFAEYRAFGSNFAAYNTVTWMLHGLNALLLYLLAYSLLQTPRRWRVALGFVAALCFAAPGRSLTFSIEKVLAWWPAQNDVLSLTFGLGSLLLLDRWLRHGSRLSLAAAMLSMFTSIGSKEMGFTLGPIMILLIWYRRKRAASDMALVLLLTLGLWVFRRLVLTDPWEPDLFRVRIVERGLVALMKPFYPVILSQTWQLAAVIAMSITWLAGRQLRWNPRVILGLCLLEMALSAQFVGSGATFALVFEPPQIAILWDMLIYLVAIGLFIRYRRFQPGLFAAASFAVVYVPVLQYFGGKHYHYWPAAFLGLTDAAFIACLLQWAGELSARRRETRTIEELRQSSSIQTAEEAIGSHLD